MSFFHEDQQKRIERARGYFGRATRKNVQVASEAEGIRLFMKRTLGRWHREKVMTIDELANVIIDLNMAQNECQARLIVYTINAINLEYQNNKSIRIDEFTREHEYYYRIRAGR